MDIKFFIDSYVDSLDTQAFGYDYFDIKRVFELYRHVTPKEALGLNKHLTRVLRVKGFENEVAECKNKNEELAIADYRGGSRIRFLYHYLLYQSSKSIGAIILTTLLISLIYAIVLLPAPRGFIVLFDIHYDHYTDIFFLNHVLNLTAGLMDLGDGFSIKSRNIAGLILMIVGKLGLILVIGNYLLQEINNKLSEQA